MQVLIISWLIFISKKIEGRIESKMSEMDSAIKTVTVLTLKGSIFSKLFSKSDYSLK